MRKFLLVIFAIMGAMFAAPNAFAWDTKFSLTTTSLSANDTFGFYMSAAGTFYVDCGADGILAGDGASGDTIVRNNTTEALYTCTYSSGGVKTINMGGVANRYNTQQSNSYRTYAVIRFGHAAGTADDTTPTKVASISGSIGQIFPTLPITNPQHGDWATPDQPVFYTTFAYTRITSVPENLFSGVTGAGNAMFHATFYDSSLVSIPPNLFVGITGGTYKLFGDTFGECRALTSIPQNLFADVVYAGGDLFIRTFQLCTSLTTIPDNLFANIKHAASYMFYSTFNGCRNLAGYVPPSTFAGLVATDAPTQSNMWANTFRGTQLVTTCPAGTVQYETGYEDYWDGHVSCVDENLTCGAGQYLPAHGYECMLCPINSYCAGGTYPYSESTSAGAVACGAGLYSPAGMSNVNQCGRILHVGDDILYLRAAKKTSPSLHIQVGNDIFYGNMTRADVPMNANTTHRLKLNYGGTTYSVYDDTVNVGE